MIRSVTEKEFIEEYGIEEYAKLCKSVYNHMSKSPEYKNDLPVMFSIMMFGCKINNVADGHVIIEATINKPPRQNVGEGMFGADDFRIISMKLTDEEFPDEIADRFNDIIKQKEIFNKENERN